MPNDSLSGKGCAESIASARKAQKSRRGRLPRKEATTSDYSLTGFPVGLFFNYLSESVDFIDSQSGFANTMATRIMISVTRMGNKQTSCLQTIFLATATHGSVSARLSRSLASTADRLAACRRLRDFV